MESAKIKFKSRTEAGKLLAQKLRHLNSANPVVFALPRGGVPVAAAIAQALRRPMELVLVKKISAPGHPELTIGAIAEDGDPVWQEKKISMLNIAKPELNRLIVKAQQSLHKQRTLWQPDISVSDLTGKAAVLVDDGMTTGSTLAAAIEALQKRHPEKIIVAIPAGSRSVVHRISEVVDEVVCLETAEELQAVYENTLEISDRAISELMEARKKSGAEQFRPQPEI